MAALQVKANSDYDDLISSNPMVAKRFLDKDNKVINPNHISRDEYINKALGRTDIVSSSVTAPTERAPLRNLLRS
jgi:nicotinamide mononucleotide adenylyltransferase